MTGGLVCPAPEALSHYEHESKNPSFVSADVSQVAPIPTDLKPSDADSPAGSGAKAHCSTKRKALYDCAVCGKLFKSKRGLNYHIDSFHEKRADFKCDLCLRKFTRKQSLEAHIRNIHEQRVDVKCELCLRKFSRKHLLEMHVLSVHEKQADFKCEICGRIYSTNDYLKAHIRNVH